MKYKGRQIQAPNGEIVAFPRELPNGEREDLIFVVKAVLDFTEFEAICPEPEPPVQVMANGEKKVNFEFPDYVKEVNNWYQNKLNWMHLKAISGPDSSDLSWDTVSASDPETWKNFREELRVDAFLTPNQIQYLINRAMSVNSVDEARMKEARERFLTGLRFKKEAEQVSQKAGVTNSLSGVPASV